MGVFYENKGLSVMAAFGTSLAFGAHLHNHIEFVYMIEGRARVFVDSKESIICGGDALIVFPNQIHRYQKIDNENYFITIFPPELCPEFHNIFKKKLPLSPVINKASANKKLLALFNSIFDANKEKTDFSDMIVKGYFLILLSELFQMIKFEDAKSSDSNIIKAILNYCSENYMKDIQLGTISDALHVNKYYISHLFSQKLHMGFIDYIGMLRISDACKLLVTQDKSITDISFNVGFNSTRTFNRLFLKYTGITPRQYKAKNMPSK